MRSPLTLFAILASAALTAGCGLLAFPSPVTGAPPQFNTGGAPTLIAPLAEPAFAVRAVVSDMPGRSGVHAASLAELPGGTLLAAWYAWHGAHELDDARVYFAELVPGAAAWSPPRRLVDNGDAHRNPVLYAEGEQVWLFLESKRAAAIPAQSEVLHSADGGRTWTGPEVITGMLASNVKYPPMRVPDGRLLLPAYTDVGDSACFYTSLDGRTWSLHATMHANPGCIQPSLARTADGRLLCVLRNTGRGNLWCMSSADDGETWSRPTDARMPNPDSAAQIVRLASGHLCMALNPTTDARTPLSLMLSADDGLTWPYRRDLETAEGEYSYPFVLQASDGAIHVAYTAKRQEIRHVALNEDWIIAGGA